MAEHTNDKVSTATDVTILPSPIDDHWHRGAAIRRVIARTFAVIAATLGIASMFLRGDTWAAGPGGPWVLITAIVATSSGLVVLGAMSFRGAIANGVARGCPALGGLAILLTITAAWSIAPNRDITRLFDTHGAVILAFAGATCGALALILTSAPVDRVSPTIAAAVTVAVVAITVPTTLALAHGYANPWVPATAAAKPIPALPTSVDTIAYRIPIDGADEIAPAGAGFVVALDDRVTAYDGETGLLRWQLDLSDMYTKSTPDPTLKVAGDTVEVTKGNVALGLDANTGEIRWRRVFEVTDPDEQPCGDQSASTTARCDDGRLRMTDTETGLPQTLPARLSNATVIAVRALAGGAWAILLSPVAPAQSNSYGYVDLVVVDSGLSPIDQSRIPRAANIIIRGPDGSVAITDDSLLDGRLFMRSYRSHQTSVAETRGRIGSNDIITVGQRYAAIDHDRLITIDPSTGATDSPRRVCIGSRDYVLELVAAPGAALALCRSDRSTRIVGLR